MIARTPCLAAAVLLTLAAGLHACQAFPGPYQLAQPSGESFEAVKGGDVVFNWWSTVGGDHLIERRSDGTWCYLAFPGGVEVLSPQRVAIDPPPVDVATKADLAELRQFRASRGRLGLTPGQAPPGSPPAVPPPAPGPPTAATEPLLILVVEFSDRSLTYSDSSWAAQTFNTTGSTVRTYYTETSQGTFTFVPANETGGTTDDGVIRVVLPTPHPDPGSMTGDPNRQIVSDALAAADPFIDYSAFDTSGNGSLSANELHIVTICAGWEGAFGSPPGQAVWGHRWSLFGSVPAQNLDGVNVGGGGYVQVGERHGSHQATIGIFCHELGHNLGLPDLYDIDGSSEGIGAHGVMGSGSWGRKSGEDAGETPCHFCAWSRVGLGLVAPTDIFTAGTYTAHEASNPVSGNIFRVTPMGAAPQEYFLIENRQPTGFDAGLHGSFSGGLSSGGLQIWHIDDSRPHNRDETHKLVDLEEANEAAAGQSQLDNKSNRGRRQHLYYGGGVTTWNDASVPSSRLYSGAASNLTITNVSGAGGSMTFDIGGGGLPGLPLPSCSLSSPTVGATVAGDVAITFDGTDSGSQPLTTTFEWSTDTGATWNLATAAPTSPLMNPDSGRTPPFSGVTFLWDSGADGVGLSSAAAVRLRATVDNGFQTRDCTVDVTADNVPFCNVSAPTAGAMLAGDVFVTFVSDDPVSLPVTTTLEFSVDAGATWSLATAAPGSTVANPDPPRATPTPALSFLWDTHADSVGIAMAQSVELRLTVDNGTRQGQCTVGAFTVDNAPSCTVTLPLAGALMTGEANFSFQGSDPSNDPVTSTVEWSTNGGATWSLCTATAGSAIANPDVGRTTPFASVTFTWNSQADGVGLAGQVTTLLRTTISDGYASASCMRNYEVNNRPTCFVTSPSTGSILSGGVDIRFNGSDPAGDALTSTFEWSSNGGSTWSLCTTAAGSPTANPDPARTAPFSGVTFRWDTQADAVGAMGLQSVDFRVTVDDSYGASSCTRAFMADNQPGCLLSSPPAGSMHNGEVTIRYGGIDPSGDPVTTTFEFSSDSGATWSAMTASAGSPSANPDPLRATPFTGREFDWDTRVDGVGVAGLSSVDIRIVVSDGIGVEECSRTIQVDNQPTCSFITPTPGATVSGDSNVNFSGLHPLALPVTSTFEFSTDGGMTWGLATPAASSPTANPDPLRATPFVFQTFRWDSLADQVGFAAVQNVELRITVDDGLATNSCSVAVMADNVPPQPTCSLSGPAAQERNDIDFDVDASSMNTMSLDLLAEFSTDGGATFAPCTMTMGSANPNPATGLPLGVASFQWDSRGDGVGMASPALGTILRVTVGDGYSPTPGTCEVTLDVDNTQLCALCGDCNENGLGPDILDALTAAQIGVGILSPGPVQTACCDSNSSGGVDVLDALAMAQSNVGFPVTLTCQ